MAVIPPSLQAGDTIALVSPSRHIDVQEVQAFLAVVKDWGFEVELGEYVYAAHNQQAGTDQQRLEDLQWALDHPKAKAIIATRGGYGLTRIVDQLDFDQFVAQPKWCVGFSDFTALHSRLAGLGIASIHSLVPRQFQDPGSTQAQATLYAALKGWPLQYQWETQWLHEASIHAHIVGGNLSLLADGCGTSTQLDANGSILFLEDVGEPHYRIDRMLVQLYRSGVFDGVKAVLVGYFSDLTDHVTAFGQSPLEMLQRLLPHVPVIDGFPSGHLPDNRALILGVDTHLTVKHGTGQLRFEPAFAN